jgi:hypothetical protein
MSNVAVLRNLRPDPAGGGFSLGPGVVERVHPHVLEVALKGGDRAEAVIALGYAYEAREGDVVLVVGDREAHYVIGVITGSGRATLSFPGDVDVRAGGVLRLAGDKGVAIEAPEVAMTSSKLRVIAGAVVQTFQSLRQRVSELLSVQAGQSHTIVEGTSLTQAKSATIVTEEKVTMNGKEIHLG